MSEEEKQENQSASNPPPPIIINQPIAYCAGQHGEHHHHATEQKRPRWWEYLPHWVMAAVTIALAVLGYFPWQTTQDAVNVTRMVERAILAALNADFSADPQFIRIRAINSGNMTAERIHARVRLVGGKLSTFDAADIPAGGEGPFQVALEGRSQEGPVMIYGRINYDDGFMKRRHSDFCFGYNERRIKKEWFSCVVPVDAEVQRDKDDSSQHSN